MMFMKPKTKEGTMKKRMLAVSLMVVASVAFSGAVLSKVKTAKPQVVEQNIPVTRQFIESAPLANGTIATITVIGDQSEEGRIQPIIGGVLADISRIDTEINGSPDGEMVKVNNLSKGQKLILSDDMFALISKARDLAALTEGWFDFTLSAKGYRRVALDSKQKTLTVRSSDIKIDISRIFPAYLVDMAMAKLVDQGLSNVKVEVGNVNRNIGRDIYTPWTVSVNIQNANSANVYHAYIYSFSNKAVASFTPDAISTPLLDPKTNKPAADGYKNVTVFGNDSMTASAFAAALYTLGPKSAPTFIEQHPEVKSIFVDEEGKVSASKDFQIGRPNYEVEPPPVPGLNRGGNDLKQKQKEESRD